MAAAHPNSKPIAAPQRGYWRSALVWLVAFSFLLLVSASASHIHKTAATLHDCAVCVVVADKLADTPAPPLLVHDLQLPDVLLLPAARALLPKHAVTLWLPPGRGPPIPSV